MSYAQPVLIVGAGPTGLLMAIELARYNIPFRIIDKKAEPTQTTNAAGIQTRTLEILEHIGLSDQFIGAGLPVHTLQLEAEGNQLATLLLNRIDSHFKFILMLPQSQTEAIFNQYIKQLNVTVERSVELIDLKQDSDKVTVTLKHADNSSETAEFQWVIGCDGYHSIVRDKSNIQMVGSDIPQEFVVADIRIKATIDPETIIMYFTKGTVFGLFPLRDNKYRIVANSNQAENKKSFSDAEIKQIVQHHTKNKVEATEILWSSPFWIHSKVAEKLRQGRVFIAGDAAHVHSPAGAQGMNTGLQDVYNLAWKLALVIQNQVNPSILNSYEPERLPIIKSIVTITEKLSHLVLTHNRFVLGLRNFFFKHIAGKSTFLQNIVAARVTQISLNYRKSPIVEQQTKGRTNSPKPGDRLWDVEMKNGRRLYDYIKDTQHHLFLFTGRTTTSEQLQEMNDINAKLSQQFSNLIKVHVITDQALQFANVIDDKDYSIHKRFGITKSSMCLVRPDQYIALFMAEISLKSLLDFIQRIGFKVE